MRKGFALTILIAILAFGTFLRLIHINEESLWLDEGITYYNSSGESYTEVWDKAAELDQSPPFYYFVMHTYLSVFGENEFGFRLIPLIFGVLSILFLYLIIAEMFEPEVGLIAAFLLAVNPFHIGFSIESRMYVLLSLESLVAFYALYKAIYSEGEYFWWGLFGVACALGLYTHNFFLFSFFAFGVLFFLLLLEAENRFMKFILALISVIFIGASFLPWLPNFLNQLSVERYWMAPNTFSDIKNYFLEFSNGSGYLLLGFLVLAFIGSLWPFFRKTTVDFKRGIVSGFALLAFLVIGFFTPLFYSLLFEPIMKIRYMVFVVPIWLGLVSMGIYAVRKFSIVFSIMILVGVVYLWTPWVASAYPAEIGEDYRMLAEIVAEKGGPVIVHSPSIAHVINFYNQGRFKILPFPYSDDLKTYNIDEEDKEKFRTITRGLKSFFLVVTHTHENPPGLLFVWSDANCKKSYEVKVDGMETYYFSECS